MTLTEGTERLAKALLLPINPAAVIILGVYTVVWGLWIANPFWTVFTQASLYSKLALFPPSLIPPEYFWGCLAIICGSVTTYGAIKRHYKPLVRGSIVAGWHWSMIAILYFAGDAASTGGITSLVFAVYAAFVYLNLRVNFKNGRMNPYLMDPRKKRKRRKRQKFDS